MEFSESLNYVVIKCSLIFDFLIRVSLLPMFQKWQTSPLDTSGPKGRQPTVCWREAIHSFPQWTLISFLPLSVTHTPVPPNPAKPGSLMLKAVSTRQPECYKNAHRCHMKRCEESFGGSLMRISNFKPLALSRFLKKMAKEHCKEVIFSER